jgi:hypothetical protein
MLMTKRPGQRFEEWVESDPIVSYSTDAPDNTPFPEHLWDSAQRIGENIEGTDVCLDCAESQGLTDQLFLVHLHETDLASMLEDDSRIGTEVGIVTCGLCGYAVYVDLRPALYILAGGEEWMNRFRAAFKAGREN